MYKIGIIPEFTILAIPYSVRKTERSLHYILLRITLFFSPTCPCEAHKGGAFFGGTEFPCKAGLFPPCFPPCFPPTS